MREAATEFKKKLCNIYMLVLVLVLPLYVGRGYSSLGDDKYRLFFNASLFCILIWSCLQLPELLQRKKAENARKLSIVDMAMLGYAGATVISAVFSAYPDTAWYGYRDWYMGALSQLLFVGIYFCVSREYTGEAYVIYGAEAALALVVLLGWVNRLGLDPLRMYTEIAETDWANSHVLSTVGNINWLCGYLAVLIPFPVTGYLYAGEGAKRNCCYGLSVLSLVLLLVQGSDVGVGLTAVCLLMCLIWGIKKKALWSKALVLAVGVCTGVPVFGYLVKWCHGDNRTPVDAALDGHLTSVVWWLAAMVFLVIYGLQKVNNSGFRKKLNMLFVTSVSVALMVALLLFLSRIPVEEGWGSGRGGLWRMAAETYAGFGWLQKLIGAGPDCFAEAAYGGGTIAAYVATEGQWKDAIYANAHNEWLNILVNGGITGFLSYLAIFVCSYKRYRNMLLGALVLILYAVSSVVGFQQVMNAPFLFLLLGICESRHRRHEEQFV